MSLVRIIVKFHLSYIPRWETTPLRRFRDGSLAEEFFHPNVQKVPNQQEKDGLYPSTYERSRELSLTKLGDYEMKNQKWLQKTTLTLTFPMSPKIFTWLIDVALSAWIAPLKSLRVTRQPFTQQISDDRRVESRRLGTFSIRSG